MKYYFLLQVKRTNRKLTEIGIAPIWGYLLVACCFLLLSKYLFYKTTFAGWIYPVAAISILLPLGDSRRYDLLRLIFRQKAFYGIRVLENTLTALPFALYLLYEGCYGQTLGLVLAAAVLAFIRFRQMLQVTIPTPFKRFPFEFIVGFRKSLGFILLSCFLLYKAVEVSNFNLGLFALALVFLISMTFYLEPEPLYFVWIYGSDAAGFLRRKMMDALRCVSLLTIPFLGVLAFNFTDKIWIIAGTQVVGYCMLVAMLLAKYSAFPSKMSLPQAIFFFLSLWFPPMLLITIPVFYRQSKGRLKPILEW